MQIGGLLPSVTKGDHCNVADIKFGLIMKYLSAVIWVGRKALGQFEEELNYQPLKTYGFGCFPLSRA